MRKKNSLVNRKWNTGFDIVLYSFLNRFCSSGWVRLFLSAVAKPGSPRRLSKLPVPSCSQESRWMCVPCRHTHKHRSVIHICTHTQNQAHGQTLRTHRNANSINSLILFPGVAHQDEGLFVGNISTYILTCKVVAPSSWAQTLCQPSSCL